jgi:hypothetical protein
MSEPKTSLPLHCGRCRVNGASAEIVVGLESYLVVDAQRKPLRWIRHVYRVSEDIDRQAACGQSDHTRGLQRDEGKGVTLSYQSAA